MVLDTSSRLGNIGDWGAGATPSRQHPEYYGGDILWLKTGDLNDSVIQDTSEKITKAGVANSSVKVNQPGNILIAMYGATIGKLGIVGKTLVTNQACCGCTLFKGIYNLYLFYYLLSARSRLIELGSGGAQPNISKTKIENFTFPLPPLEEQKRIVAKIEKLMPLVDEYAESYNRLQKIDNEFEDKLKQSVLQYAMEGKLVKQNSSDEPASELIKKIENEKAELIKEGKIKKNKKLPAITDDEKPFDIPDSWEWVRLGELLKPEINLKPKSSFEYIDIASLNNKTNTIKDCKTYIWGKDKIPVRATKPVSKGDILYSTVRPYLRNVAIVPDKLDNQIATSGFYVLKPLKYTDTKYIFYLLLSPYLTNAMHEKMKGINSPSIKKSDLKNFVVVFPPLEEQKRIVTNL